MGMFLNSIAHGTIYRAISKSNYFVDKTKIIEELIPIISDEQRFICITRPRRFGKTIMANMLGTFFSKAEDTSDIFNRLEIGKSDTYKEHLNKHDVIYIDFSEISENCKSYKEYIKRINDGIKDDLCNAYPDMHIEKSNAVWDIFSKIFEKTKGHRFIFIFDEWDAIFHMPFISENDKKEFILYLKSLLKSKAYVDLAYMTGILPIAKYSEGSELNMFLEFQITTMEAFSEYFGFTEDEVNILHKKYLANMQKSHKKALVTREGIAEWYNGYHTLSGMHLYNPRSVISALQYNQLSNYWTSSGTYDSIFYYIKNNIDDVCGDLALMVAGEKIPAKIQEYAAVSTTINTKNEIYSAMVVYGLLTYNDGYVMIPNKEIMLKFEELLLQKEDLGYIHQLAKISNRMLEATLAKDTKTITEILQQAHNTETPILSYNNETELAAIVNLVYLSARDRYYIERENKAGKGFVDFIFYPKKPFEDCIILELKVGQTPDKAIKQIIEKQYALKLKGKLGETPKYTGKMLAVGISYDKKSKEHNCKIQELNI